MKRTIILILHFFLKVEPIIPFSGRLTLIKKSILILVEPRKFYIRRNNNKIDSTETGRIVIAHLLP